MSATAKTGGHANNKLWVRMYRVGFGDCFLVAVPAKKGPHFILIDCGEHKSHLGSLPAAVADIAAVTGKHLALVIATHRHADHIRGFYQCAELFQDFTVDAVWLSHWDNPDNGRAVAFQSNLVAQATAFEQRLRALAADDEAARAALGLTGFLTGADEQARERNGSNLTGNKAALAMLTGAPADPVYHFKNNPVRAYYRGGEQPTLPAALAATGLKAAILGPPTNPELLDDMDAPQQYLQLAAEAALTGPLLPFDAGWRTARPSARALHPLTTRQLDDLIARLRPEELLAGAARADRTVNNQSLVVLFTLGRKTLLFSGDAQWGNWEQFLFGQEVNKATAAPPLLEASRKILAGLRLYKVGHHGSTNATPIVAVEALRQGVVSLCSTEPDCHGHAENNSEVPRQPLLIELGKKGSVIRSDQVAAGDQPPTQDLPTSLPKHCTSPRKQLFIDYEF